LGLAFQTARMMNRDKNITFVNLGRLAIIVAIVVVTHLAIRWAMLPGFWSGSMLHSGNETALQLAQDKFGPILLVKRWLDDPEGTWGSKNDVLQNWGYFETAARLRLIIWTWCGLVCVLAAIAIKRRTKEDGRLPPEAAASDGTSS